LSDQFAQEIRASIDRWGMIAMKSVRFLGVSALAIAAIAAPYAAYAQTPAPQSAPEEAAGDQIIVTGTRIARPNVDSPVPITSVTATELLSRGSLSIGDTINQLPQFRSTFSQANSTRFIGTAGINALDLRGLGTTRTLVLVNGRRMVTATPGVNRPDVNTIPNDLLERVDTVTGGNSAIYGSDAVAGVVNFVLKDNFEGFRLRGQGGVSSRKDRGSYFISGTAGKNFDEGRGNVAFAAEYAFQDVLFFTDRDQQTGAFSGRSQFQLTQNTGPQLNPNGGPIRTGSEPATGDGIADRTFLRNIRNNGISEGGLFTATCPTAAATGESAAAFAARRVVACSGLANVTSANALSQYGTTFVFQPDGSFIRNPCIVDYRPFGSGNCQGGLGSTLRLTGMLEPQIERIALNFLSRYEVSEALEPFVQAQFVRVRSLQEGQPTFFNNTFQIANPFLSAQARAAIQAASAPGATTFVAQRFNVDFGGRGERHKRDQFQVVGGVRGTFNDDWRYEATVNYAQLDTYYETAGNLNRAKYANSIDATTNATGQIVCRINADAVTTNDDPACVPVNLFGNGAPSRAALNYFLYTSSRVQKAKLYDVTGYMAGDLSQLFELPGGPIAFVIGGQIRRETGSSVYDSLTSSTACGTTGCTFLNVLPDFRPPDSIVKEAFGEISIPLLKDLPFAHELTIDAAGRFSNYNLGKTGTVFAWNVNGTYAPIRDLRIRAGYARSIRAPNQSELFGAASQTFLNGLVDPCGQQNINNNPNRSRNCSAAGVPTTQTFTVGGVTSTEPFSNRPQSGIAGTNGNNPNLLQESADSVTVGMVFQPQAVPGLTLSVDYYWIRIKNAINSLTPQTIIDLCYDSPAGINNPFCPNVFRNANGTFAGQSNVQHAGTTVNLTATGPSFIAGPFNYAKNITTGIDADLSYRTNITDDTRLVLRGIASKTYKRANYTDPLQPNFAIQQLFVLGDPEWQGQYSVNLEHKGLNVGYRFRYIGKTVTAPNTLASSFEQQNAFQGRPPLDPDGWPTVFYPSVAYNDLRIDYSIPKSGMKAYFGVDNVFDRLPPLDLLGVEAGSTYSTVGRFFYAGIEVKF
jgi:outer membrane receptor protein involved in Fe transport